MSAVLVLGGALSGRPTPFAAPGAFTLPLHRIGAAASPAAAPLPLNAALVTVGDSITSNAFAQGGPRDRAFAPSGFVYWFLEGLDHRLRVAPEGNLAVGGFTLDQIHRSLGERGAVLNARGPDVVSFLGGTNNLNDTATDAQLASLYDAILAVLLASSARLVILWGIPPRPGTAPLSAEGERQRRAMNALLSARAAAAPSRMLFVDVDGLGLGAGDFADPVHPNARGARAIGLAGARIVAGRLAAGSVADLPAPESYSLNPTLAGDGPVAPGWSTADWEAGGASVAFSKDGRDRQRMLISGTAAGTGRNASLDQYGTVDAVGRAPAEDAALEAVADFEIVGTPAGIAAIDLVFGVGTAGYANLAQGQSVLPDMAAPLSPDRPGRFVARTVCVRRGPGAPHFLSSRLVVTFRDAAAPSPVALDLRINRIEFRRAF